MLAADEHLTQHKRCAQLRVCWKHVFQKSLLQYLFTAQRCPRLSFTVIINEIGMYYLTSHWLQTKKTHPHKQLATASKEHNLKYD